jgi:hypothetical protein
LKTRKTLRHSKHHQQKTNAKIQHHKMTLPMAAGDDQGRSKFDGSSSSAGDSVPIVI